MHAEMVDTYKHVLMVTELRSGLSESILLYCSENQGRSKQNSTCTAGHNINHLDKCNVCY